jgi:hypothetical protein
MEQDAELWLNLENADVRGIKPWTDISYNLSIITAMQNY